MKVKRLATPVGVASGPGMGVRFPAEGPRQLSSAKTWLARGPSAVLLALPQHEDEDYQQREHEGDRVNRHDASYVRPARD